MSLNQQQYIVGEWSHLFPDENNDRPTRIVIDAVTQKLVRLQVQQNRAVSDSYRVATRLEVEDVEDSIVNANPEVFDAPADFGLEATNELPAWAVTN